MSRLSISLCLLVATSAFVTMEACPRPEQMPPPPRPNIVLITIEAFRADHTSIYGYERNTTPNIDRLARQGATFEQAIAQAPFTLPSLASLMTGRTPPAHGVRNHPARLPSEMVTLAEQLSAAGYRTAAMTRHSWLRRKSGFDQGFAEYHNNTFSAGLDARSLSLAAVDWLRAHVPDEQPFFLWLHFLDPHLPYTPGYPYAVLFHPQHRHDPQVRHLSSMMRRLREDFLPTPYADLAGGPHYDLVMPYYEDNGILLDLALWRRPRGDIFFGKARHNPRDISQMRDLYDGALAYTDDNVARVLRTLRELGIEANTLVVVAGDHGEALGDHGLYFAHDFTLYDEVLRVPLIFRMPERIKPGTVIHQQVRLMDVAPTVLELAGTGSNVGMEAVSLAPLLEGRTLPYLPAFAESAPYRRQFPQQDRVYYKGNKGKWRMVRTERQKLIFIPKPGGDLFELYDLLTDPAETRNRAAQWPGEVQKLWPLLKQWMERDPERDADRSQEEQRALDALDPATRQQLEVLGYIQPVRSPDASPAKK